MGFPWKSYMNGRLQDREIQKFMDFLAENSVYAAYGGMTTETAPTGLYDLDLTWTKYTDFDGLTVNTPKDVEIDLANNRLRVLAPAVYLVTVRFVFSHDEFNAGREFSYRLFDESTGTPGKTIAVGVGRNNAVTNISASAQAEILTPGGWISIELGNGDDISGTFSDFEFSVSAISNYIGDIPE